MYLNEIHRFVNVINEVAQKYGYLQSLNAFRNAWNTYRTYKQQVQSPTNVQQSNNALLKVESDKKALLMAAEKSRVELENIPDISSKNYEKFFGNSFVEFINSINQKNAIELYPQLAELYTAFQHISQFKVIVESLNLSFENWNYPKKDNLLEIVFQGEISIKTLKEFSKHSEKWIQTINLISRLSREANTDLSVESVRKGSLILLIGAAATIVVVVCKAIDKIQNVMLKHIEIQQKTFELRKLQIDGFDDILKQLDQQAKTNLTAESNAISSDLLTEYEWQKEHELYNEVKAATRKAVKNLIRFLNKGGVVKGYLEAPNDSEKKTLRIVAEKNVRIKELETHIKELSSGKEKLLINYLDSEDEDHEQAEEDKQQGKEDKVQ